MTDNNMPPSININDIKNVIVILDSVCARGAFRANEMAQIGQIYDKFTEFVASVENAIPPSQGENVQ